MSASTSSGVTRIYSGKGPDGLSRMDRERSANYNRTQFLFDKFIQNRKKSDNLQLTHEHILNLGDESMKKIENINKRHSVTSQEFAIKKEVDKLQKEIEQYKKELIENYQIQIEEEKDSIRKSYDILMARIEKQRDEAEEERVKELIRKMNEECDQALKKQRYDLEELKRKQIEQMREIIRKEMFEETEQSRINSIKESLVKAEEDYEKRESEKINSILTDKDNEWNEKLKSLTQRYDASTEALLQKLKETEQKYKNERSIRLKLETDFRLLQTDYKRFMNYTDHYNSDYMMKLRHIGAQLIDDKEFEQKLNEKLKNVKFSISANGLNTSNTNNNNKSLIKSKMIIKKQS